ncbi:MCE family protein [Gordonia crocea]|uniref:ABC transporter substrate-binding protein n=1 Tax=Gordonia crocea TaxID=589162 RepID=A0A7I9UZV6_9ACTN|nr:MlaD family protein [Gordonia crocea]GED98714.1 ABC transporter substrate-binding protein [Gordonia crocea]
MTRLVKTQLIVFAIVGILAMVYVGVNYARLPRLAGLAEFPITVQLPDSGGLFANAEVTYQGVPVGRVQSMTLTENGVDANIRIRRGAPKIPQSAAAVVASRSAIGEQYLDLRPKTAGGPYMTSGSVVKRDDVTLPQPLEDVVNTALDFAESVPVDDLRTIVEELGKAFNGQGENLTKLVTSLNTLSKAGYDSLGDTIELLAHSSRVLATQAEQSDAILAWSKNLDVVTATLASADPDVRRLLTTGQTSATALSNLLQKQGADITTVVKDLGSVAKTAIAPTGWSTNALLAMVSALSAGSHSPAPGDGQIHFGVVLEMNNPAACTQGYESTQQMIAAIKRKNPTFDINYDDFPLNLNARCTVPQGSPTSVRGAARATLANPNIPQPWDNKPKKDPDRLDLNPLAWQLAWLLGVHPTKK